MSTKLLRRVFLGLMSALEEVLVEYSDCGCIRNYSPPEKVIRSPNQGVIIRFSLDSYHPESTATSLHYSDTNQPFFLSRIQRLRQGYNLVHP